MNKLKVENLLNFLLLSVKAYYLQRESPNKNTAIQNLFLSKETAFDNKMRSNSMECQIRCLLSCIIVVLF